MAAALPVVASFTPKAYHASGLVRPKPRLLSVPRHGGGRQLSSIALAKQTSTEEVVELRRSGNYKPNVWEDKYIQSLRTDLMEEKIVAEWIDELKEEIIRHAFGDSKSVSTVLANRNELTKRICLIDTLQQLGVAYLFEEEVSCLLTTVHGSIDAVMNTTVGDDLHAVSLLFRLLRAHGLYVSPDVFDRFRDGGNSFKPHLRGDVQGILSLYEASFLAMDGESQMDEATDFAVTCLRELTLAEPYSVLNEQAKHALELPLHWRMQRAHARGFIDLYERVEDSDPTLLRLAKLDFNRVQGLHKSELKELSKWKSDLHLEENLPFVRERPVEDYMWAVGFAFEPKFSGARKAITEGNSLVTTIDDIYDVYGSLEELHHFTDAVDRWDASAMEKLPDYMKTCFLALYNTTNDTAYKAQKEGVSMDVLLHSKRAWAVLCRAYLQEAKWYHEGYTPTMKEYLGNAWITISGHLVLTNALCMSNDSTQETQQNWFRSYPDVVRYSSMLLRLCNDLATSTAEIERGDVPKSIQCVMHDRQITEAMAREQIQDMIASTWKKLNRELITNSSHLPESIKTVAVNIPRTAQWIYQNGDHDGYANQGENMKGIALLLIEPIEV